MGSGAGWPSHHFEDIKDIDAVHGVLVVLPTSLVICVYSRGRLVDLLKNLSRLWIVALIRMMPHGQFAEGALDVVRRSVLGEPERLERRL